MPACSGLHLQKYTDVALDDGAFQAMVKDNKIVCGQLPVSLVLSLPRLLPVLEPAKRCSYVFRFECTRVHCVKLLFIPWHGCLVDILCGLCIACNNNKRVLSKPCSELVDLTATSDFIRFIVLQVLQQDADEFYEMR